jgi:hydroxymethylbilane synthase
MGITGIFTRSLDIALLNGEVDIAVHSMKDVPTQLPLCLTSFAVLEREDSGDLAVLKSDAPLPGDAVVATGSLRRKAQWLKRHPGHRVVDLRGNVQTRLSKLENQPWHAALFAKAGLERMGIRPEHCVQLDWMMPAPAQGAILVVGREEDHSKYQSVFSRINHAETENCVALERAFLRELEGGCTAPIGALAQIRDGELEFRGGLYYTDGSQSVEIYRKVSMDEVHTDLAHEWARSLLEQGGERIMQLF